MAFLKEKLSHYAFIFAAIGLVSCSSDSNNPTPELSIESVSIYAAPDANQNSATAVDLVIVYDHDLEKMIGQMSAAKYFGGSKQLLLDNPSLLEIWHWELVPGQVVYNFQPPQEQGDAHAAYVFANYLTPGDHRVKVAPEGIVKIILERNDLRNVAPSNTQALRMGTTMSNVPREGAVGTTMDEDIPLNVGRLGPTQPNMQAEGMCAPPPTRRLGNGSECQTLCPPVKKPAPIVTRPLCAPPAYNRPPIPKKVKVWHN